MNEVTKKLVDMLTKAAEDNSSGGGFTAETGVFRILFEPPVGDTSASGLIKALDRKQLEAEWQQIQKDAEAPIYDKMKLAIQNDLVCQIHRDLQHRYCGRISRMLNETARKQSHAAKPEGHIAMIGARVNYFEQLKPELRQE